MYKSDMCLLAFLELWMYVHVGSWAVVYNWHCSELKPS